MDKSAVCEMDVETVAERSAEEVRDCEESADFVMENEMEPDRVCSELIDLDREIVRVEVAVGVGGGVTVFVVVAEKETVADFL